MNATLNELIDEYIEEGYSYEAAYCLAIADYNNNVDDEYDDDDNEYDDDEYGDEYDDDDES